MERFPFFIAAQTPAGFYPLSIVQDPQYTFLADASALSLPLTIASGGLRVIDQLIPGDFNQNSYVDGADYQQWRNTFGQLAAPNGSGADGNRNGVVDAGDYTVWRDHLLPSPGDYDASGLVDTADYLLWKRDFGSNTNLAADGNRNGRVDAADYTIWRDHVGQPFGSAAAVPEPSTLFLTFILSAFVIIRRSLQNASLPMDVLIASQRTGNSTRSNTAVSALWWPRPPVRAS